MASSSSQPDDVPDIRELLMRRPRNDPEGERIQKQIMDDSPVPGIAALFIEKAIRGEQLKCFNNLIISSTEHCQKFVPVCSNFTKIINAMNGKMKIYNMMEDSQRHYVKQMSDQRYAGRAKEMFKSKPAELMPYLRGLASYYYNAYNVTGKLIDKAEANMEKRRRLIAAGNVERKYDRRTTDFAEFYLVFLKGAQHRQLSLCRVVLTIYNNTKIDVDDKAALIAMLVKMKKENLPEIKSKGVRDIQFTEFQLLSEMFINYTDELYKDFTDQAVKCEVLDRPCDLRRRTRLSDTTIAACQIHRHLTRLVLEDAHMAYTDLSSYLHKLMILQREVHSSQLTTLELDCKLLLSLAMHEKANPSLIPRYPRIMVVKDLVSKEEHLAQTFEQLDDYFQKMSVCKIDKQKAIAAVLKSKELKNYEKLVENEKEVQQKNFTKLYLLTRNVLQSFGMYALVRKECLDRRAEKLKSEADEQTPGTSSGTTSEQSSEQTSEQATENSEPKK